DVAESCGAARVATDGNWKQTNAPGAGWQALAFNDSSWGLATDEGPLGNPVWPARVDDFPLDSPARWIWSYDARSANDSTTTYFRRTFTAEGTAAILSITSSGGFTAYLNNVQVAQRAAAAYQSA